MRQDPDLPDVFDRAMAASAGLSRNQVTRRLDSGVWHRLVQGAFTTRATWDRSSPAERHVLLARATLITREQTDSLALSHVSAGVLNEFPLPTATLGTVWTTTDTAAGRSTRYGPHLRQEVAVLPAADLRQVDGLLTTNGPRTLADLLRHLPVEVAVPAADAALHHGVTTLDKVELVLDRQAAWPGATGARAALSLVDGRRESVLESRSAIVFDRYGVPPPTPQVVIVDADGRFVARTDFAWLEYGVVGEADGAGKYGDDPLRAFRAERDRQAALEALGLVVVRWDWRHLHGHPPEAVRRVLRALEAGDARRFRGAVA